MSDKKEQIQKLIEHNDELENYFRNTIIPQLYVDGELKLRKFTPPAMRQFSLADSDIGKPIMDIKDNLRFPTIVANIQDVINTNEILEKEIQTTDLRWYQMDIIPYLKLQENKIDGVIITFVEITKRIRDLKEQEKLNAEHALLLDTISHDLKNPLSNLMVSVELLKSMTTEDVEEFNSLLDVIDTGLGKMNTILRELTDKRKSEHINNTEEELLNFEHILEDVRLTLRDNIMYEDAKVRKDINSSEVNFSRRKFRSVLYNLINNALKFKAPERPPEITVTTKEDNEYFILSVKDNGIGIPESNLETIFTKYGRIDKSIEGTGVGLYLVKEIVSNAGGKISVNSEVGVGSEFQVYLKKPLASVSILD